MSNIYYAVVEWLWLKLGEGGDGEKGAGVSVASREFAPTDKKAVLRRWAAHQRGALPSLNQAATE